MATKEYEESFWMMEMFYILIEVKDMNLSKLLKLMLTIGYFSVYKLHLNRVDLLKKLTTGWAKMANLNKFERTLVI